MYGGLQRSVKAACAPRGRAVPARVLLLHPFSRLASVKPAPDSHVRRMLLQLVAIAYFGLCIYLLVVRSDCVPFVTQLAATADHRVRVACATLAILASLMISYALIWDIGDDALFTRLQLGSTQQKTVSGISHLGGNISLSVSGSVRSYAKCISNHVDMILKANPHARFSITLASQDKLKSEWLHLLRRQQNVAAVHVLPLADDLPAECNTSGHAIRYQHAWIQGYCVSLWKQFHVQKRLEQLQNERGLFDMYLHTRFDIMFDSALRLDEVDESNTLFVSRSTWFKEKANSQGDVENQLARPITWRGERLSLRNRYADADLNPKRPTSLRLTVVSSVSLRSVPDYVFAGRWWTVSPALLRFVSYTRLLRAVRSRNLPPVERILIEPELFLSHALRENGIEFGDPVAARAKCVYSCLKPLTYQILFMRAAIQIVR